MATQHSPLIASQKVNKPALKPKPSPYPHQEKAIQAIVNTLNKEDRTHVVMACGTGKTHLGLWVAEKLEAKRIVIFVPSLALINQMLHEWISATSWKEISYLAVCSDKTVTHGVETESLDLEQYTFPITTNPAEIYKFLKRKRFGVTLVFCTYQSSKVLSDGMARTKAFELAIFDEGHRTTGTEGRGFSLGLSDSHIKAKKRLFMTATPKHYKLHTKNKENRLVYSMDDVSLYGPRAYTLSFREAINRGLISDYKVIISTVIREQQSSRDKIAEWDEKAIALEKSITLSKAKKVITFHNSIVEAEQFVDNLRVKKYLSKFLKLHVNSFMPVSRRVNVLTLFKEQKESLISNARCLTEGTNVPAVDMVAFLNPKRSKIDIVQAIGRALRLSPGKDKGYIFLPLFIDKKKNESIEDALERTEYGEIWEVLQALSEQDEDLHNTVQSLRQQKGHDTVIEPAGLDRYIQIQSSDLDKKIKAQLNEAIFVSILEKLGYPWDEMYGKLCEFHKKYNHCHTASSNCTEPALINWVNNQRNKYRKEELSTEKINALTKINFSWNAHETRWYIFFEKLKEFFKKNGHCDVPEGYKQDPTLACWVSAQRQKYKIGKLSKDRTDNLNSLKFNWIPVEIQWNIQFNKLKIFWKKHGHCRMSQKNPKLYSWISMQRRAYKVGTLPTEKIDALNSLGFNWIPIPIETLWNTQFKKLKIFWRKNRHCIVPEGYKQDPSLAFWVGRQRQARQAGDLSKDKIDALNSLGFNWTPRETRWNTFFQKLKVFWEKNGHCKVPKNDKDKSFARWVDTQRQRYKKGKLSPERVKLLNSLKFIWAFQQ